MSDRDALVKAIIKRDEKIAELEAIIAHRFSRCTWCGWTIDYTADTADIAYSEANAHALTCKADPRNARIAALEAAGEAMAEGLQLHTATKDCDLCVVVLAAWREATKLPLEKSAQA